LNPIQIRGDPHPDERDHDPDVDAGQHADLGDERGGVGRDVQVENRRRPFVVAEEQEPAQVVALEAIEPGMLHVDAEADVALAHREGALRERRSEAPGAAPGDAKRRVEFVGEATRRCGHRVGGDLFGDRDIQAVGNVFVERDAETGAEDVPQDGGRRRLGVSRARGDEQARARDDKRTPARQRYL
jgi:hypothetical protein